MKYDFDSMINRIKSIKKEKGLTNLKLSELSGVPYGTLNKILGSETKEPSINAIIKIAKALDVSADYIISGKTNVSTEKNFSLFEQEHIKKYRILDEYGKKAVSEILEIEYERCTKDKSELIKVQVAARSNKNTKPHYEYITKAENDAEDALLQDPDEDM